MKSTAALTAAAALFAGAAAAPTSENGLAKRDARVPSHVQLYAQVNGNGTNIGCINGRGNFIRNLGSCAILSTTYTSGNNGNDGILSAIYSGYYDCTISTGPLDGAIFTCENAASTNYGQFWNRDGWLSIDGPTGIAFSINSLPAQNDVVGVPLIIGGSGAWGQFQFQIRGTSG